MSENKLVHKVWGYLSCLPFFVLIVYCLYYILSKGTLEFDFYDIIAETTSKFVGSNGLLSNIYGLLYDLCDNIFGLTDDVNLISFVLCFVSWKIVIVIIHFIADLITLIPDYILSFFERRVK